MGGGEGTEGSYVGKLWTVGGSCGGGLFHAPPTRGTVCAHVQCVWDVVFCANHYLTVL